MKKVLVVDDEGAIRDLVGALLEDEGYEVFTAENGKRALCTLRKDSLDLVLLDVMMPVMDGKELLRQMSQDERLRDTRVVVMSAAVKPRVQGARIDAFLAKPFDISVLIHTVSQVLDAA